MGWSVKKALVRTGAPALGLLIAKVTYDLTRGGARANAGDLTWSNVLAVAANWIVVAALFLLVTRVLPGSR